LRTVSYDIDLQLRIGPSDIATSHIIANASDLPLVNEVVDLIAAEPPYNHNTLQAIFSALSEFCRMLTAGGRISPFMYSEQPAAVVNNLIEAGFQVTHPPLEINRRGTAATAISAVLRPHILKSGNRLK
jgi:hypothetical protein